MPGLLCANYKEILTQKYSDHSYEQLCSDLDGFDYHDKKEAACAVEVLTVITEREKALTADFLAYLSENEREFISRHADAVSVIPQGSYCYTIKNIEDNGVININQCPHASMKSEQSGQCDFMGLSDDEMGLGLLWDGVKECGVKKISAQEINFCHTSQ